MARNSIHVTHSKQGGWNVRKAGASRASAHFDTKDNAVDRARELSRNQHAELVIHGKDGKIQSADSHGPDPYPPKG